MTAGLFDFSNPWRGYRDQQNRLQAATKRAFSVCVTMAGRGQIIPSCDRFAERKKPNHATIRDALSCNRCHDRSEFGTDRTPFGRCNRQHDEIAVRALGVLASASYASTRGLEFRSDSVTCLHPALALKRQGRELLGCDWTRPVLGRR